ncbi:hypothetical protein H072_8432 [Dactylellina haptotyla CBS 200.50]|uniref:Uncharacterized protein n=1 Tax=Dactylellina haptotyla (strain CBS 200.50) TaxID=1284197 RepID=S8BRW0_DACHA|nr:hypothetical protein H072_8432 [Dactylellina haptotyla CBS 200.50]
MASRVRQLSFWSSVPVYETSNNPHIPVLRSEEDRRDEIVGKLTQACSKFPNIQSLIFETGDWIELNGKVRSLLNLFWPDTRSLRQPGTRIILETQLDIHHMHIYGIFEPVMEVVARGKLQSVEFISCPFAYMEDFQLRPNQVERLKPVLGKLRELEISGMSKSTPRNQNSQPPKQAFYSWMGAIGINVETLRIGTPRARVQSEYGNGFRWEIPPLNLSNLKRMFVANATLTMNEVGAMLCFAEGLEELTISNCRIAQKSEDDVWFTFLQYLKGRGFKHLRRIDLDLSTGHECKGFEFELPRVEITGNWNDEFATCIVKLPVGTSGKQFYVTYKDLQVELDTHETAEEFWGSLTNEKWTASRATRQARVKSVRQLWEHQIRFWGSRDRVRLEKANKFYGGLVEEIEEEEDIDSDWEGIVSFE